jgi:hypothetical protein
MEVGGWPAYASGEPPVDTASDGILANGRRDTV